MTYYVQIPCFVSKNHPNRTATPNSWIEVEVRADSPLEAIRRVERALVSLSVATTPIEPDETSV